MRVFGQTGNGRFPITPSARLVKKQLAAVTVEIGKLLGAPQWVQVDSRTIIDGSGAEMLLGNGDMLFIPPGKSEPSRLQGAFLSSDDTEHLMKWYQDRREAKRAALVAQRLDAMHHPTVLARRRAHASFGDGRLTAGQRRV